MGPRKKIIRTQKGKEEPAQPPKRLKHQTESSGEDLSEQESVKDDQVSQIQIQIQLSSVQIALKAQVLPIYVPILCKGWFPDLVDHHGQTFVQLTGGPNICAHHGTSVVQLTGGPNICVHHGQRVIPLTSGPSWAKFC
jgi:hypothetical protein